MAVLLLIGNLSYDVTEAELRARFVAISPLSAFTLPMDRDTGKPRGFAFVEFHERADAEEAIRRFDTQQCKGRPLAVNEARTTLDLEDDKLGNDDMPPVSQAAPIPSA